MSDRERAAAIARLYDWYLASVDVAANIIYPSLLRSPIPPTAQMTGVAFDQAEHAVEWLDSEQANLIAAIQRAADNGRAEASWLLSSGLRGYFTRRIHLSDLHMAVQAALQMATATEDLRAQASMHLTIAHVCQARAEYDLALKHLRRGAELGQAAPWHELEAMCLGNMAGISLETGTLDEARRWIERSIELCRKAGYRKGEAISMSNLGVVANKAGRLADAVRLLRQACEAAGEMGLAQIESGASDDLGEVLIQLGRLDEAEAVLDRSLRQKKAGGDWLGEALVLSKLAIVQLGKGRNDQALGLAESAANTAAAVGNRPVQATTLAVLGAVRASMGDLNAALSALLKAAEITSGLVGAQEAKIIVGLGLAEVRHRLRDGSRAADQASSALESARRAGFRVLEGRAIATLAHIEADRGRRAEAASLATAALENQRQTGHLLWNRETTERLVALCADQEGLGS